MGGYIVTYAKNPWLHITGSWWINDDNPSWNSMHTEQWRQPYVTLHAYAKEAGLHANKQDGRIGPNVTVNVTG